MRGYVKVHRLAPQFRYLIGSEQRADQVWQKYEVQAVARDPELIDHTAYTLLIDRAGRGIVLYPSDFRAEEILTDLRRALEAERLVNMLPFAHGDRVPVSDLAGAWEPAPAILAASGLALVLFAQAFVRLRRRGRTDHAPW